MELFLTLINLKFHWISLSSLKDGENEQNEIKILLTKLRKYNPTRPKKKKAKEETLNAAEKLLNKRQEVIEVFKTGIFLYEDGFKKKVKSEEKSEELEEKSEEQVKDDFKKFIEYTANKSKGINYDFFKHFNFEVPSVLAKQLYETKNKNKNHKL